MRKLLNLSILLVLMLMASCSGEEFGEDTYPSLLLTPETPDTMIVYADEVEMTDTIMFNSNSEWNAEVENKVTEKSQRSVQWLRLSQYSGAAGSNIIGVTMDENTTGMARTALVKISNGLTMVSITVEQKAIRLLDESREKNKQNN